MTVAVRRYEMQVPYGVVECEDARIIGLREKPQQQFLVNAGLYLLGPAAQLGQRLPAGSIYRI